MGTLHDVRRTIRYTVALAAFLRGTDTYENVDGIISQQVADRESNFLFILEHAVFSAPDNPYHRMLRHAGYDLDGVRGLVAERGLEGALDALYDAGVYVTHDELRGRAPVRRGGLEFAVTPEDFDNPLIRPEFVASTSGSTGTANRVQYRHTGTPQRAYLEVLIQMLGAGRPWALWQPPIGVYGAVVYAKHGKYFERIFLPTRIRLDVEHVQVVASVIAAKLRGKRLPWPKFAPRNNPIEIARWLAQKVSDGTPAVLHCHPSTAVRVCLTAREAGLDISGTLFYVTGEPFTPGKKAVLDSVGASSFVAYMAIELGMPVGLNCLTPRAGDDMHLMTYRLAMVTRERKNAANETVEGMHFTIVNPLHGKLVINWESTDYAKIEKRTCDCPLGKMGFTTHISEVQSYEKLTSEGVTFSGSWLYGLVETELPARFGGQLGDYQLAEEEDADGLSRVRIVVSPRVGSVDDREVIAAVIESLIASHGEAGAIMAQHWRDGGTLQVVRREPQATITNKVAPLRVRSREMVSPSVKASTS
ncbi:MAG TPA: hypothetical protein VI759_06990 [Dehalococcoidia bacterium]|nr:hypothetical protein [Dehalococcoidia bacterium]